MIKSRKTNRTTRNIVDKSTPGWPNYWMDLDKYYFCRPIAVL